MHVYTRSYARYCTNAYFIAQILLFPSKHSSVLSVLDEPTARFVILTVGLQMYNANVLSAGDVIGVSFCALDRFRNRIRGTLKGAAVALQLLSGSSLNFQYFNNAGLDSNLSCTRYVRCSYTQLGKLKHALMVMIYSKKQKKLCTILAMAPTCWFCQTQLLKNSSAPMTTSEACVGSGGWLKSTGTSVRFKGWNSDLDAAWLMEQYCIMYFCISGNSQK